MKPETIVLIPAFNEAATIRDIAERTLQVCPRVIIVDDGSTDDTVARVADLPLTLIQNEQNLGKAGSLWRGMQAALEQGAEAVLTLDGDGQHRPEDIPRLLAAAQAHPGHMIIGSRLADKAAFPPKRYYANKVANFWISWAAGYGIEDSQSGFRLYPARLLREVSLARSRQHSFVFESEILIRAADLGIYSYPVPIAAVYEQGARPSHFRGVTDIVLITRMVATRLILGLGCLPRFYRAFVWPRLFSRERVGSICNDGWFMLLLSLLAFTLSLGLSGLWVLHRAWRRAREAGMCAEPADCLLVLGMRLQDGRISEDYRRRLDRAAALAGRQGRVVVLGGVTSRGCPSEAAAGVAYLRGQGLPEERLMIEDSSRHTLENLQRARELMQEIGCRQAQLITNRYHLWRSLLMAQGLGLSVVGCPAEDSYRGGLGMWLRLLKEAFFVHWYLTGRTWGRITANDRIQGKIS